MNDQEFPLRVTPIRDMFLPPHGKRERLATAVHRAICQATGTDGLNHCADYAHAGVLLATMLFGRQYKIQAGGLALQTPVGWQTVFDPSKNRPGVMANYHTWFIHRHSNGQVEIVDLAARHYCENARSATVPWKAPHPPSFIWDWGAQVPSDIKLVHVPGLTIGFSREAPAQMQERVTILCNLAMSLYMQSE